MDVQENTMMSSTVKKIIMMQNGAFDAVIVAKVMCSVAVVLTVNLEILSHAKLGSLDVLSTEQNQLQTLRKYATIKECAFVTPTSLIIVVGQDVV